MVQADAEVRWRSTEGSEVELRGLGLQYISSDAIRTALVQLALIRSSSPQLLALSEMKSVEEVEEGNWHSICSFKGSSRQSFGISRLKELLPNQSVTKPKRKWDFLT